MRFSHFIARDKIIEFLIADPVRKAEFYILQSDKRLGMTSMLLEKGNTTLAETTLSKGETYMEKTISTLVNYKASGKEIPGYLLDRLTRSIAKHIEVLTDLFAKATDPMKTALANAIAQAQKLQGEAAKLK
ncbi:hypothetical protein HY086_04910 [Candidatus Gottesmanbacteria bacterium]|nr:hypothetical protein [Candidatus Gottesmanbacteria bacterium]